jgi:hypothetical protein
MPPPAEIMFLLHLPDMHQAYLVARAIGRRGTEGHGVAAQTRDESRMNVDTIAGRAAERIGRLR